ncbi:MAG: Gfo/Idh/MocA family oxidoreductase [candidate division WS1 bacterium]|jgi:predicted dehydrogenase|nr:Gfo/Idh/MocA family oxidoreductase [candidate division WS1 bacterium]
MEKLRVGILGLRRGMSHLRNFMRVDEAEVIGCADRIESMRERAREVAPDVPMVAEFEELLEMEPDAIAVATNGRMQAQHTIQALQAGCHVLSEVPGAFTAEECHHIVATVQLTGKQYMLAENSSFLDFLRYWRKWVMEKSMGEISMAEGEYLHYLPNTLITVDGERYTPAQCVEDGISGAFPCWRADQPPIQYLTHDLGPLLEVLDDHVVSVSCREAPWWQDQAPLRSDGQIALFQTAAGRLIKITVTLNTMRPASHNYRLFGTRGSAEWYSHEGFCRVCDRDREEREGWECVPIGTAAPDDDKSVGHGGTDIKTAYYFTKAILGDRPVPIDVYRMCDYTLPGILAARSAELGGQPITVPDVRTGPRGLTDFWNHVPVPESEPDRWDYKSPSEMKY